jgi:uncharacterized Zn-binding protein involved in type VI secretion
MPPASKLGDMVMHPGHTPATIANGSANVFINSIPAAHVTSMVTPHCTFSSPPVCHPSNIAQGSPNVFVNGKPLARLGDKAGCGASIIQGSANVIAN